MSLRPITPDSAHTLVPTTFWKPTFCCICNGLILMTGGLECSNDKCHLTVHRWGGKEAVHENCKGEALSGKCPNESECQARLEHMFLILLT